MKVWDARVATDQITLNGHSVEILTVALSGDGTRIFAQEAGGKIVAWDSVSGQLLPDAPPNMPPGGPQASTPDGKLRVRIENDVIRVYRADWEQARQQRKARDREFLERLARFDPDRHRQQLDEALAVGDDFAIAFHLERLVREQPWDASLRILCAHVFARLGRRQESATHLAQALLLNPRISLWPVDPRAAQRGEQAAQAGDWPRAVQEFQCAVHQPHAPVLAMRDLLLAQVAASDTLGMTQTGEELARHLKTSLDEQTSGIVLSVTLAVPCTNPAAAILLERTRDDLKRQRNAVTLHRHGAALYRAGQYPEAERSLRESVKAHGGGGSVETWFFLAMAAHHLGKHDEAAGLLQAL